MTPAEFLRTHQENMQQHTPFVELPFYVWLKAQKKPPKAPPGRRRACEGGVPSPDRRGHRNNQGLVLLAPSRDGQPVQRKRTLEQPPCWASSNINHMSNEDITPFRTEVISDEEARGALAIHERREAMESALDIAATTTKLQAKEAVEVAKDQHEKAREKYQKAAEEAEALLDRAGLVLICDHPLTRHIIEVVKVISGVTIKPECAWHGGTHYSRVNRDGDKFTVRANSVLDFEIQMADESGDTVTTARNKAVELELKIDEWEGLEEAVQLRDDLSKEVDAAAEALERAKQRLNNHASQVDAARVQLQRGKLKDMGSVGEQALEMVDKVIEASEGKGYLELL